MHDHDVASHDYRRDGNHRSHSLPGRRGGNDPAFERDLHARRSIQSIGTHARRDRLPHCPGIAEQRLPPCGSARRWRVSLQQTGSMFLIEVEDRAAGSTREKATIILASKECGAGSAAWRQGDDTEASPAKARLFPSACRLNCRWNGKTSRQRRLVAEVDRIRNESASCTTPLGSGSAMRYWRLVAIPWYWQWNPWSDHVGLRRACLAR